ncbi:hypothetical protein [Bartonella apis]|uniref:hypothetical protein n=1 Tax=Bartonella apis TaxID=1686310 RepID=UPI0024325C0D|nr:hypothetical protein [Bartonella apis]
MSPNPCNRIARFGNHQARMNVATSPPTAAPARFAPPPLLLLFTSARFCSIPLFSILDRPLVFSSARFYCSPTLFSFLIFIALSSMRFSRYGLDLLLTLLMQF